MELTEDTPRIGIERWSEVSGADARKRVRELAGQLLVRPGKRLHAPPGERPRLLLPVGEEDGFVSMSHTRTGGGVALADAPIGVDLEWPARGVRWQALADAHFAAEEQAWLGRQPPNERKAAFLVLWTLKEAWLKAQGRGVWRLGDALFTPLDNGCWRIPGAGWRGECRLLGDALIVAAVWLHDQPPPQWLEAGGGGWRDLDFTRRWPAASGGKQAPP